MPLRDRAIPFVEVGITDMERRESSEGYDRLLRQQSTLAKFGELALSSDNLDEILNEACRVVGDTLGTHLAKVVEFREQGTLFVRAGVGWKPGVVGETTMRLTDDLSESEALRTGQPVISPDTRTETRFKYPQFMLDNGVRAAVNVIIVGGAGKPPFGVLEVDSREPRQFTDNDASFLRTYANLLAAAVVRLRTIEDVRRQVQAKTRDLTEANAKLEAEAKERERIEDALRQSHKMEAVGQLTGGLAHDFNNRLASISANLEMIRARARQGRPADIEHYVAVAMNAVNRAASVTHRLLAFSRRQALEPAPTDVNRLIDSMEELCRQTLGPGIKFEMRQAADLWRVRCDPNQLESALLNLLINARDAMPQGGKLVVETENTLVGREPAGPCEVPEGEYVSISVTDTGSGMTPEVLAKAFDPFFTTKPIGQGTGLGLSMIYGFVQQSGGRVLLKSEVGRGTTATIQLPRYEGPGVEDSTDAASSATAAPAPHAVVLVVEDESSLRTVIVDVLSDRGYVVLSAQDGQSGLRAVESTSHIDLLLTDVGLPGRMNGRQLADAARRLRPDLKVIFVTGYPEHSVFGEGRLEPGMEVLKKPVGLDVLTGRIEAILSHG